jgi:hypothetical protein
MEPNVRSRPLSSGYFVPCLDLLIFFYSIFAGALFLLYKQIKRKGKLSTLHSESIV